MKRALLMILILANLGVFAWARWYAPAPTAGGAEPAPPLQGKPLQLMSELSPAERQALAQTAAPAAATVPALAATTHAPAPGTSVAATVAQACASYGPFPSADAASQGMTRVQKLGLTAVQHMVAGKTKRGYWVYLPPFRSRREADGAAAMLRGRGVKDIYVVTDEANRNAISLGVFSQRSFAVDREREIKKLGFRAQMAARFRDEPRYWLDIHGAAGALPQPDAFKDLADESAPIGRASSACAG